MMLKVLILIVVVVPQELLCYGEHLSLTSDAPAILGSNVTFFATLENTMHADYTIVFQENYPIPNPRVYKTDLTKDTNYKANWTVKYNKVPGNFTITVTVAYTFIFDIPVDYKLFGYEITQNFTGVLQVDQPGVPRKQPWSISTLNETELEVKVHDPSNYLRTANYVNYTWILNDTVLANYSSAILHMNFSREETFPVRINITASFPEGANGSEVLRYGSFVQTLSAKVPIVNFTLHGATWFRHGNMLELTVTCEGTSPYEYCWLLKIGPYNHTGNETCEPTVTTECKIQIIRYLIEPGTYNLLLLISNDVGKVFNQTGIHVYKTTRKPQLSVIIVPVSFTLIAIVLIIFGIAYYWENHVKYTVEVADFDFGQFEEAPYIRFLDRLREAVSNSVRQRAGSPLLPPDNDSSVYRYGSTHNDAKD